MCIGLTRLLETGCRDVPFIFVGDSQTACYCTVVGHVAEGGSGEEWSGVE